MPEEVTPQYENVATKPLDSRARTWAILRAVAIPTKLFENGRVEAQQKRTPAAPPKPESPSVLPCAAIAQGGWSMTRADVAKNNARARERSRRPAVCRWRLRCGANLFGNSHRSGPLLANEA
jgi:hypothetical protein